MMDFETYVMEQIGKHPSLEMTEPQFSRLRPVLEKIAQERRGEQVYVIALDGRAASGKSTMAKQLGTILDADVVQMDDFFLPPALRTEERFRQPGGNVHYERFLEEVIPHLSAPEGFSYRVFDCGKMDYNGTKHIKSKEFRIVEGSYSCHPAFGDYADLTVFLQVEPEEQMRRILARNGEAMAQRFRSKWIPLEETYFAHHSVAERADLQL